MVFAAVWCKMAAVLSPFPELIRRQVYTAFMKSIITVNALQIPPSHHNFHAQCSRCGHDVFPVRPRYIVQQAGIILYVGSIRRVYTLAVMSAIPLFLFLSLFLPATLWVSLDTTNVPSMMTSSSVTINITGYTNQHMHYARIALVRGS